MNMETSRQEIDAKILGFDVTEQEAMDKNHYKAAEKLTGDFSNPLQRMVDFYVEQTKEGQDKQ